MRKLFILISLLLAAPAFAQVVKPTLGVYNINQPLFNCGTSSVQRQNCPPPPSLVSNPAIVGGAAIAFWVDLNTAPNVYNWAEIENQVAPWNAAGKKTALVIWLAVSDVTTFQTTPAWVYNNVAHNVTCTDGTETFTGIPDELDQTNWWPQVETFVTALLAQYGSDPRIAYIRIGWIGSGENGPHCMFPQGGGFSCPDTTSQMCTYGDGTQLGTQTLFENYINAMIANEHAHQGTVQIQQSVACYVNTNTYCRTGGTQAFNYGQNIVTQAANDGMGIENGAFSAADLANPSVCAFNWCGFMIANPTLQHGEQAANAACTCQPGNLECNTCTTGPISQLYPFACNFGGLVAAGKAVQTLEWYPTDLLSAYGGTPINNRPNPSGLQSWSLGWQQAIAAFNACGAPIPPAPTNFKISPPTPQMLKNSLYVSPEGNDGPSCGGPATFDQPLLTPACATQRADALQKTNVAPTVYFMPGMYQLPATWAFGPADSGSAAFPITYASYPGTTAIISGGTMIGLAVASSTWTATLLPGPNWPMAIWTMINTGADFTRRGMPFSTGFPGNGTATWHTIGGGAAGTPSLPVSNEFLLTNSSDFCSSGACPSCYTGTIPGSNATQCTIVTIPYWNATYESFRSLTGSTVLTFGLSNPTGSVSQGFLSQHGWGVLGAVEPAKTLAAAGSMILDRTVSPWQLTYFPTAAESTAGISNVVTVVPTLQTPLLTLTGAHYITFQNMQFSFAGYTLPEAGYVGGQWEPNAPWAVIVSGSDHIIFTGGAISHNATGGLFFSGSGGGCSGLAPPVGNPLNQVTNFQAYDNAGAGIQIEESVNNATFQHCPASVSQNVLLQNVQSEGNGWFFAGAYQLTMGDTVNSVLTQYEAGFSTNSGVGIGTATNPSIPGNLAGNTVSWGYVHDIGQGQTSDLAGIYGPTGQQSNPTVTISNNFIRDVIPSTYSSDAHTGDCFYLDQGSSYSVWNSNLCVRPWTFGAYFHIASLTAAGANQFVNNVIVFPHISAVGYQFSSAIPNLTWTASQNIFEYASNIATPTNGSLSAVWGCLDSIGRAQPCPQNWLLTSNLWYDTQNNLSFSINTNNVVTNYTGTGAQIPPSWQAIGEDVASAYGNPLFVSPNVGSENWALQSTSPAFGIGFVPWNYLQAGSTLPEPTTIVPAFPQTVILPAAYPATYGQP